MMIQLNFLLLVIQSTRILPCVSSEAGIKVRVTKPGLEYANRIGAVLLNNEISTTAIPAMTVSLDGGPGHGSATAQNIRIINYRPLTYTYILHPPNGLEWSTSGGSITIAGDWVAWYKVIFKIWLKGGFTASVNNIHLSATVSAIKDTDLKPAVKLLGCNAQIGSVNVQISGGFIQSIINLFRSNIASAVKSAIEGQVCQQAKTVLISTLNKQLKSLPTKIDLGSNFMLDYSLHSDPIIGTDYAEGLLNGSISWKGGSQVPIHCPPLPPAPTSLNRMIYVWGSDYVLNTFLQTAHYHGASRIDVDRHSFPEAGPYLRTTCPGQVCAGNISHVITDKYPNKYTMAELMTRTSPSAVIKHDGARLSAQVRANLYVEPKTSQTLLMVFDIDFAGQLTVKVVNNETDDSPRLTGDLVIDEFHVRVNQSNIGYISPLEIDLVVTLARPFIQKLVNEYLNKGVVVPTIPDVKLINAGVTMMERAVQVEADMIYKNYTSTVNGLIGVLLF